MQGCRDAAACFFPLAGQQDSKESMSGTEKIGRILPAGSQLIGSATGVPPVSCGSEAS